MNTKRNNQLGWHGLIAFGLTGGLILLVGLVSLSMIIYNVLSGDPENASVYAPILSGISTLVLVGVTAWYAKTTRDMVNELEEGREQDVAPVITYDISQYKPVIANVGNGPATNIEIDLWLRPQNLHDDFEIMNLRSGEQRAIERGTFSLREFSNTDGRIYENETLEMEVHCSDGFGNDWSFNWSYDVSDIKAGITGDHPVDSA